MSRAKEIHNLNGYIHNVAAILKYLKDDAVIENEETKAMLDLLIAKEEEVLESMKNLKESKGNKYE